MTQIVHKENGSKHLPFNNGNCLDETKTSQSLDWTNKIECLLHSSRDRFEMRSLPDEFERIRAAYLIAIPNFAYISVRRGHELGPRIAEIKRHADERFTGEERIEGLMRVAGWIRLCCETAGILSLTAIGRLDSIERLEHTEIDEDQWRLLFLKNLLLEAVDAIRLSPEFPSFGDEGLAV